MNGLLFQAGITSNVPLESTIVEAFMNDMCTTPPCRTMVISNAPIAMSDVPEHCRNISSHIARTGYHECG